MARVALFFAWFFGFAIGLPGLVLGIITLDTQAPFAIDRNAGDVRNGRFADARALLGSDATQIAEDLRARYPQAVAAAGARYGEGTQVVLLRAPDASSAQVIFRHDYAVDRAGSSTQDHDGTRYETRGGGVAWIAKQDEFAVKVVAPDLAALRARRAGLPGFRDNPERSLGNKIDREYLPHVLAAILAWAALVALQFGRVASWAGGTPAVPGIAPVDERTLAGRLLAINDADLPFAVKRGRRPEELIVEWRFDDTKWLEPMRVSGVSKAHRLILRLDPRRNIVRAMDQESALQWSAGAWPRAAGLSWSTSYGITFFRMESERAFGIMFVDGRLVPTLSHRYRFDLRELKAPAIAAIANSGWSYRPVITFWRLLGG